MKVQGIDHVNIIAADLDQTLTFYETLLGLRPAKQAQMHAGFQGGWLYDDDDRSIIHLMTHNADRHGAEKRNTMPTGSIDHVALACIGFDGMRRRCEDLNIEHAVNDRQYGDLRQIFVTDPNNVKLELNFAGH